MELVALPAFADNYIWMLRHERQALVVDPGEETPVLRALQQRGLTLTAILVTHAHADHVAGLDELRSVLDGAVFGPASLDGPGPTVTPSQGQVWSWCGHAIEALSVPGHTVSDLAYVVTPLDGDAPVLFSGDTLFSAGCGRLFEGTPAQMHASLQRLAALTPATRVCCAHEYTLANLRFAQAVEPDNADVAEALVRCTQWRRDGLPTLPSTIEQELRINPFLRCDHPDVMAAAQRHGAQASDGVSVFAALRAWKNTYQ